MEYASLPSPLVTRCIFDERHCGLNMINVLFAKYLRHALSRLRTEKSVRNPHKLFTRITIRVGDDAVHACYRESYAFQISESIGPKGDNLEINNLFMKPGRVEFQG